MMKIIPRPSTILAFGWLVLFMGVNSIDISPVESLPESTVVTTPHPKTKFIMDLRITNRIYHDSLNDQESEEYKSLKQEVEQLFFDVYGPTSLEYLGTYQMTFRNGSVIVSAQLLFGTTMIDPVLGRSLFFSTYKQLPSPTLEIDLDHAASVNSVAIFAEEPSTETTAVTTLQPESKFYFEIRITNRIYNTTLEDQESAEYVTLRQEVDKLFWDVYSLSAVHYINTDQVTFRNGSVIAGADLLFGTNMINRYLLRNLFLLNYKTLKSPQLRIDHKFIAAELPTLQPLEDTTTLTSTTHHTSTHSPTHHTTLTTSSIVETTTHTLQSSTTLNPTSTPLKTTMHLNTNGTQSPKNTSITSSPHHSISISITPSPHNITNVTSSPHNGTSITPSPHNITNVTSSPHNITNITSSPHNITNITSSPHNITNITSSPHNITNVTSSPHNITNITSSPHNITNITSSPHNITYITLSPHNITNITSSPHNITNITLSPHNITNITSSPHNITNITSSPHNITNITSSPHHSITTPPNATLSAPTQNITRNTIITSGTTAGALVPGWGIALLVLAAISLLLLIILLIILLVMCCCWPNKTTVVKEPEVITPPMYFNPDIPMYSTHSTIDSPNGKQVDVREKPPKNRTGMYVVNK